MTHSEWRRLGGFGAGVVLLHVLGFGLFLYYLPRNPARRPTCGFLGLAWRDPLRTSWDERLHIVPICR